MKDKTYPAICRAVDGKEYLYANKNNYYSYQCSAWDKSDSYDNHENDTNITREYLEGKCVKIESPEHSEFVQKLAFNAGFKWATSFGSVKHTDKKLLIFKSSGSINFGNCADYDDIQITIPLPPKAVEVNEWPQIGDDVVICDKSNLEELFRFKGKSCKVIGVAYYEGVKVLTVVNKQQGIAAFNMGEWIKKPKTEAEILRDELIELAFNQFNDGSHPLDRNAYYLISELMDKYNITKKPQ